MEIKKYRLKQTNATLLLKDAERLYIDMEKVKADIEEAEWFLGKVSTIEEVKVDDIEDLIVNLIINVR